MEHAREDEAPEFEASAVEERGTQTKWAVGVVCAAVLMLAGWAATDIRSNGVKAMDKTIALESDLREMKLENRFRDERLDRFERKIDLLLQDRGIRVP